VTPGLIDAHSVVGLNGYLNQPHDQMALDGSASMQPELRAIDAYNAQDVGNTAMGPGFRWTVVVPPDTRTAVDWIRANTPADAVVQMSITPRGRETWTLVPTFAERRMAAGQRQEQQSTGRVVGESAEVDALYRAPDAAEAARIAQRQRIDYVYLDEVERQAFGEAALTKFDDPQFFSPVFRSGSAAVYQLR